MPKQFGQINDPAISHPRSLYGRDKSARQVRNGRREAISELDGLKIEESQGQPISAVVLTVLPPQRKRNRKGQILKWGQPPQRYELPPYDGEFI